MGDSPRYLRSIEGSEVAQNDLVAGILAESLEYGPELLNRLQAPELGSETQFSQRTQLVAAQEKIQSNSERELDWVFEDSDNLIVGYESKKKAGLGRSQLYDEALELTRVGTSETTLLIVISDHVRKPEVIAETQRDINEDGHQVELKWVSWDDFLSRLEGIEMDEIQPQHEPLVRQLSQALDSEGYGSQFSELLRFEDSEIERLLRQQDQLIGLIHDLDRLAPDIGLFRYSAGRKEIFHWGGKKSLSSLSKSYNPLILQDIMIPFVPAGYDDFPENRDTSSAFPGVFVNLFEQTVYVGIHVRPNKNERHHETLLESNEKIAALAEEHGLAMYSMWNSWGIGNTHESPEEIEEILTEERLLPDEGYKRLVFGWPVTYAGDSQEFVSDVLERLEHAHQISWEENRDLFYPSVVAE